MAPKSKAAAKRRPSPARPSPRASRASASSQPRPVANGAPVMLEDGVTLEFASTSGPAEKRLQALGWVFASNGQLRNVQSSALYSRETFEGDYDDLAGAITDYVVEAMQSPPWSLKSIAFTLGDAPKGTSNHVFVSAGAHSSTGPLVVLIHGIGCRGGVWSRSLCATHSLGFGAMFAFLKVARSAGMECIILDAGNMEDPYDGEMHTHHCVQAWRQVVEKTAASEIFVVAHSYGGASFIDILAIASEESLNRVRSIAFTDSVHNVGKECLQLRPGGLSEKAAEVLRECGVLYLSDDSPVGTVLYAFNDDRGCRCVSAGVNEHSSTNAVACTSIFAQFKSQSLQGLQVPDDHMDAVAKQVRTAADLPATEDASSETRVRTAFEEWDVSNTGSISLEDLVDVMKRISPNIRDNDLAAIFLAMDCNKDGVVDYSEFITWIFEGSKWVAKAKAEAEARAKAKAEAEPEAKVNAEAKAVDAQVELKPEVVDDNISRGFTYRKEDYKNYGNEIIKGFLFLTSRYEADDVAFLKANRITHILNVAQECEPTPEATKLCKVIHLPLRDSPRTDILEHFDKCFAFIDSAKKKGGRVLVHCFEGRNRSASFVIAYVMKQTKLKLSDAFAQVKETRTLVDPNIGFRKQLIDWERSLLNRDHPSMPLAHDDCIDLLDMAVFELDDLSKYTNLETLSYEGHTVTIQRPERAAGDSK